MNPLRSNGWLTLTLLCVAAANSNAAVDDRVGGRPSANLDGTWSFRLDPDSVGETEAWFRPGLAFADSIQVPGAWDAQGFGPETEKLHHNFIGKGWYARDVEIPEAWRGRHIFLCFGGVYRAAKIWVNGQFVGRHLGYVSDFEFDVTPFVAFGRENRLAVQVDSEQRWEEDALQGCLDIIDHLFTYWGGIWGHVDIEARAAVWLDDPFVAPRTSPGPGCTITARISGKAGRVGAVTVDVLDADGAQVATQRADLTQDGAVRVDLDLPAARLWTPETPHLHTAVITLLDTSGAVLDHLSQRFGVRSIELRGNDFLVNGVKYYLAGYGDDCVYPDTIAPPADKQFYVERLRVAKSYGFNYVRHHSHFVAPEYYEACDEVGMFVSPELPIGYPRFYDRAQGAALELYKSEWDAAIRRYRNHPSIFDWCMGNEQWEGMPRVGPDLYRIAKELDPTRPVIDSDGIFSGGFTDGSKDRPTLDFLPVMFDILTTPLDNPGKFVTGKPLKPMITHEEGNFVQFPRLDEIDLYKTTFKPFWLTDCRDRIERAGLFSETPAWSEASERLYALCHKTNIEALRKNPYISGYHWWLLQPWYVGSNGLLDVHRRPNSVPPEEVRRFNAPVVLLEDGIKLTYRGGETLEFSLKLSNYSGVSIEGGAVRVSLSSAGATFGEQTFEVASLPNGEIGELGTVHVALPTPQEPQRVTVDAILESAKSTQSNEWSTWVYPLQPPRPAADARMFASPDAMGKLASFGALPLPSDGQAFERAVYVAHQLTQDLLRAAERGSCVVLLSPAGILPTDCTSYKSAWWLGVFDGDSNAGTYVYENPITRGLAPENWCDASWFHLIQGAQTFLLDGLPSQPEVLIRALNTHGAPHGFSRYVDFEYVWRNKALLMQAKVGEGSLIFSGLNFDAALRNGGPEADYVLGRILEHASHFPSPSAEWPVESAKDLVARSPFTKGPLIPGYERVVFHKGEKVTGQSCRAPSAEALRIRQEEPLHRIVWETAPVPAATSVVFVFAGGFLFMAPPASNPGFTLTLNGVRLVDFDTTKTQTQWTGADGRATLLYVPGHVRPSWSETAGLFYVSVPGELTVPGKACTLEVRARGADNKRWFALHPYADLVSDRETE
ncbi:MAG: hypothetical protein IT365_16150 [Candidatus Hydrogenedentes bacterium]|nr:hypothetical protein [Candidatus Hydrogenedentota bacterium]